ncbi:hypothetical protein WICANDRAFT_59763 [Wickerhamomyces anomalus NRRL Y-366-8]|uniref:Vacuolar ATPase assembly integral membrane protein VMA21 n=1 Tax=Wickerhamomyces anomalus (strain ATCC 58044 / CBS 1984 / NCYC 433 / NRRL Y-366-8) TaxID=683960 RepID=A0A1E3P8P4_WICAA|nr:uncharacterized protein WICANDRAFT_59763 [Wickerhamomyces anomalus NRRL Y-366-8]ODQ61680.1 hypothetical protein WICANDRAFT_59763 [Wickerhamomyces anomalus NRRL Y-366-8]
MAVDIPKSVLNKLIFFTGAIIFFPLITFFLLQYLFGNSIVSGGMSAVVVNILMVLFIIVAFNEKVELEPISEKQENDKLD